MFILNKCEMQLIIPTKGSSGVYFLHSCMSSCAETAAVVDSGRTVDLSVDLRGVAECGRCWQDSGITYSVPDVCNFSINTWKCVPLYADDRLIYILYSEQQNETFSHHLTGVLLGSQL